MAERTMPPEFAVADWDDDGALAIESTTWDKAVRLLEGSIAKSGVDVSADTSPCRDGSVDLYWTTTGFKLLANITPSAATSEYYGETTDGVVVKGILDPDRHDLSGVLKLLNQPERRATAEPLATRMFELDRELAVVEDACFNAVFRVLGFTFKDNEPDWSAIPCDDWTRDDYDESFELKKVKQKIVVSDEQAKALRDLGFCQCWICYDDDFTGEVNNTSGKREDFYFFRRPS